MGVPDKVPSKTHDKSSYPQVIKIYSTKAEITRKQHGVRNFCLLKLVDKYLKIRRHYQEDSEHFFIFSDGSLVTAEQARHLLKKLLTKLGLNSDLYDINSLHIG